MNIKNMLIKAKIQATQSIIVSLKGRCMEPLLKEGDKVKVIEESKYEIGDLCLIELPNGELVVHRLLLINGKEVLVKGDRARRGEIVLHTNIIGKVEKIKLFGFEEWHIIKNSKHINLCVAKISLKTIKDNEKQENKYFLITKNILMKILIIINYVTRLWYKLKYFWGKERNE